MKIFQCKMNCGTCTSNAWRNFHKGEYVCTTVCLKNRKEYRMSHNLDDSFTYGYCDDWMPSKEVISRAKKGATNG